MALEIFYGDLCDSNALISSHPQDETKSLEVLGIIYRHFHKFFTPATLLCLHFFRPTHPWVLCPSAVPLLSLSYSLLWICRSLCSSVPNLVNYYLPLLHRIETRPSLHPSSKLPILLFEFFHSYTYSPVLYFNSLSATGDFSRQKFFTAERHRWL